MQQQQLIRKEVVETNSKEIATWKSIAGTRDETKYATGVEIVSGNCFWSASKVYVDTDLSGQEADTDALLGNAANAQEIDGINK